MIALSSMSWPLAALWCFGLTLLSAVFPWVNAEIIVLTLPSVAHGTWALVGLVIVATIGQMAGKCVVFWTARRGARISIASGPNSSN